MEYKKKLYIAPKINAIIVTMESVLLNGSQEIEENKNIPIEDIDEVI